MNLYDVFVEGYHTPLTPEQIGELFRAGRLRREHRCKKVDKATWRTIDELFPLLKYDSVSPLIPQCAQSRSVRSWIPIAAAGVVVTIVLALAIYFAWPYKPAGTVQISARENPDESQFDNTGNPTFAEPVRSVDVLDTNQRRAQLEVARTEQQRQTGKQMQRDQAAKAEQLRASIDGNERARQQTMGKDFVVPLDVNYILPDVGGSPVEVRVHDNDVTSFDVWINGAHRREVPKQKGISGSRTDETLIYSNGRASLYYVWEISGRLNHCLLRVRD